MAVTLIVVLAWLGGAPASGTALLPQDLPAPSSTQSPSSPPADPTQTTPAKSEPPATEKEASDSAAKKHAEGAPAGKRTKRHRVRKSVTKPTPVGQPRKIVVREGGATAPPAQIVPGVTPQQASQEHQHALELLRSAEENLKQLAGRALDSRQQETVEQIHNYVDGARSALNDGDTQRAQTLALKAQLLADDLVKH